MGNDVSKSFYDAAKAGNIDEMRKLLTNGADLNSKVS
jgi:hypothetical protein